ncbi:DegT/DnrJ/EryC1/StrS family aminotransferase [Zunongwangia sp.]|uniref:DegT/DnrJ/EryC1/StrS family aminotransferase n=1 Tax=Zunongwangia sp. TaxID=1965325 RepID=UPI003AA7BC34
MKKIWLSAPHMSGGELENIKQVFQENWIAPVGHQIDEFENRLAAELDSENSFQIAALNSGTAAIHLALKMLGVGKNDYVLCQTFSFVATVNPILYQGATPIFIDSEPETYNIDPALVRQAILDANKKKQSIKAIIAVHSFGMPYNCNAIQQISEEFKIPIIEDAAEALGSTYKNKRCGTFGDFGVFSFNGNKIITTSAGGALVCKTKTEKEKAISLATQSGIPNFHFQHSEMGYNYRMSNVLAGIGLGQLEVLQQRVEQKIKIHKFYQKFFKDVKGVKLFTSPSSDYQSNYWLNVVEIDAEITGISNTDIQKKLAENNIESRPVWKPLHTQCFLKEYQSYDKGIATAVFKKALCLPSGTNMIASDLERIKSVFLDIFSE